MAHKVGPAKPPIEKTTALKGILVGLAVMALAIVLPLVLSQLSGCVSGGAPSGVSPAPKPSEPTAPRTLPESAAPLLNFKEGQTVVTLDLRADIWSRWVEIPEDIVAKVDYSINVEPRLGYFVRFKDGTVIEVQADSDIPDFDKSNVRRHVFRLLGNANSQKAIVTISYRYP